MPGRQRQRDIGQPQSYRQREEEREAEDGTRTAFDHQQQSQHDRPDARSRDHAHPKAHHERSEIARPRHSRPPHQPLRRLQRKQPEARCRQHQQHRGDRDQHQRILQCRAEQSSRQCHGDAGQRKRECDSEHVDNREHRDFTRPAALVAEIRDRDADQRIDARRQIKRESAEQHRKQPDQHPVDNKDIGQFRSGRLRAAVV